jgi:4-diphosphocytidyl-2-C-methyl-D-erythritol kinase
VTTVEVFAPAKINLTLHVTGRRADSYHLIDTLVAFAGVGDTVTLSTGGTGALEVSGCEAAQVPATADNLIGKQARHIGDAGIGPLDCRLHKRLPVASGIGGGSADAAAYYRGVVSLSEQDTARRLMGAETVAAQWRVGADVPMCIRSAPARVTGIGDVLDHDVAVPELPVVLVNPRIAVATTEVFANLKDKRNPPMHDVPGSEVSPVQFLRWLAVQRNDLQDAAVSHVPKIAQVLDALGEARGCALARMSGSGATCFGLFETDDQARLAAETLRRAQPGWWIRATRLDGHRRAAPQVILSTT